jgi:hypothetical protein
MEISLNFSYKFERCLVLSSYLKEPPTDDIDDIKSNIKINVQSHYQYIIETNRLFVDLFVRYESDIEEYDEDIFSINIRNIFKLKSEEDLVYSNEDRMYLDVNLEVLSAFTTWAFSTTRGIIHEKLNGSRFSDVILPIMNESDLRPQEPVIAKKTP